MLREKTGYTSFLVDNMNVMLPDTSLTKRGSILHNTIFSSILYAIVLSTFWLALSTRVLSNHFR